MSDRTSESTCEVVKIVEVSKHPNADRLEIAKFAFANGTVPDYQVVVGKGDFIVGELAVYISDDMLVPVGTADVYSKFGYLKARLDYKIGNPLYRIRAAKIRGEISTGLLVDIYSESKVNGQYLPGSFPLGKLGEDMSSKLGVVKYENPLEVEKFPSQPIKRGLFARISRWLTKKFSSSVNVPAYGVVALRKEPNYFKDCEEVIYTEKIHGSNIRFGKIGRRIYIGSHRVEKSSRRGWFGRLFSRRNKQLGHYYGRDVWSEWFCRTFSSKYRLQELPRNIIFYGELYGPGIQPGFDYGLSSTSVKVFDAYDVKSKRWLNRYELAAALPTCVDMVDELCVRSFNREEMGLLAEENSSVGSPGRTNNIREGVVVRSVDWSKAGKHVSTRYLTTKDR